MKLKLPFDLAAIYEKSGVRTPEEKKRFHKIAIYCLIYGMLIGGYIVALSVYQYTVAIVGVALLLFTYVFHKFIYPLPPDNE